MLSDDQVKSATLIQNNNMDYENIARRWQTVTLENDRRLCADANDSQSQCRTDVVDEWKWEFSKWCSSGVRTPRQISNAKKKKTQSALHSTYIYIYIYWISDEIFHLESVPIYDKTHVFVSYCLSACADLTCLFGRKRLKIQHRRRSITGQPAPNIPKSEKTHVIQWCLFSELRT